MVKGIIVLEGPDAAGKTMLANKFMTMYGATYIHATYRFADKMPQYQEAILRKAIELSQTQLVIIDRLWLSEAVYAKVFRGGSPWPMMGRMFDRVLQKHGAVTVICSASTVDRGVEWFKEVKGVRPEMYEDVTAVVEEYINFMKSPFMDRIDFFQYNRDNDNTDLIKRIVRQAELLRGLQEIAAPEIVSDTYYNFAGAVNMLHSFDKKYLFIGERSNPKGRHITWPFFEHSNSSLYLTKLLEELGIGEHQICWVNALDDKSELIEKRNLEIIQRVVDRGAYPVCLGRVALGIMSHIKTRDGYFGYAPHPQYGKRFMKKAEYKECLRKAMEGEISEQPHQ